MHPDLLGRDLLWRRLLRVRGPMPIALQRGIEVVGRMVATDALGRRYRATAAGVTWEFAAKGFLRNTCIARDAADRMVAMAHRSGFRRRRVRLASGAVLECVQSGIAGRCHEVFSHSGDLLLTAKNTGGALRWHGSLRVHSAATIIAEDVPLLTLFLIFLAFNSNELSV